MDHSAQQPGSGRFRLPLPASTPAPPPSGDLQGRDLFPVFLSSSRHAPRQRIQHSGQQMSEPRYRDSPRCDPPHLQNSSDLQYAPPQQLQQRVFQHAWSEDSTQSLKQNMDPFRDASHQKRQLYHQTSSADFLDTQDAGPFRPERPNLHPLSHNAYARNRSDTFLPSVLEISQRQRTNEHQILRSAIATGGCSSSPAAQAAIRHQKNSNKFGQNVSSNVTVSQSLPLQVPMAHDVFSSFPVPRITPPDVPFRKCLALPHAPPFANGILLINPKETIPDRFQTVFPYDTFNAVQSKCFNSVYTTNSNVVVSAPTGSGKTALLELAICKLVSQKNTENVKIVYIAPTKALCKEKAEQWRKKFAMMSMLVSELTGDTSRAEMRNVREAKVIVTTPEKWDSITRSWADHRKLLDLVELFLIDEVHILKESRGATLEAVVSRMKTYGARVRFIALSATVPNSDDIAAWLGRDPESPSIPAHREVFGEQFRPVKLQKVVHGIEGKLADHPFDKYLNTQLWKFIEKHTQKKPMLVFCMTRKSCRDAAEELAKQWNQRQPHARLWPEPRKRIPVIDASLQELVRYGVAFHHAGLESDDRNAIHQAFEEGHLSVICCTSTLAVGINLPCHTVVLKGTVCYRDGGQLGEYSDLEIMQMLGRAGRPQYENSALAIILTRAQNKKRYQDLESGQQILESTLHKNLIEHVNSEISLGSFQDIDGAKLWLSGTFLSVRLGQNPQYYGNLLEGKASLRTKATGTIEEHLGNICKAAISKLRSIGLIHGEAKFQHTEYGRAMSRYMISFETMEKILDIPRGARTQELLRTLCEASEFQEIRWQANEKEMFRDINNDPFIMYPVEGNVSSIFHKISLLIQMELGRVEPANVNSFERQRLRGEARRVLDAMHRLIRAVIECKGSDSDGASCWAALDLARSLTAKAWEGRPMQLLQVPQLGPALMRKLVSHNIRTVHQLADTDPGNIERIASRNPPFGKKLKDSLALFPSLSLVAAVKSSKLGSDGNPLVHVGASLGFLNGKVMWMGKVPIVTFLATTTGGALAYFCRESLNTFKEEHSNVHQVYFTWSPSTVNETLICRFACEEIVGTVVSANVSHNFPASAFPKPFNTDQPLRIAPQKSPLGRAIASTSPLKDEVEDVDMLGLFDDFTGIIIPESHNEIDSSISDGDLLAILDRDADLEKESQKLSRGSQKKAVADHKQAWPRKSHEVTSSNGLDKGAVVLGKPVRLPNGNYKCGHPCSQTDGGTTVRGDKCGHECCRNGSKHPPKKLPNHGKKRSQIGDEHVSELDAVPDFSLEEPPIKRARASDTSKSKTKATTSRNSPAPSALRASKVKPEIDLSLYDVDEDGLIDLTLDYDPADDYSWCPETENKLRKGNNSIRQATFGRPSDYTDNYLAEFFDDDLVDLDIPEETTQVKQHEFPFQQRRNLTKHVDEFASPAWLDESHCKTDRHSLSGRPRSTNSMAEGVPKSSSHSTSRGKRGPGTSRMDAIEVMSPPRLLNRDSSCDSALPIRDIGDGDIKSSKDRVISKRLRRASRPLLSSTEAKSMGQPAQLAAVDTKAAQQKQDAEPAWVNDFEPEFISEFRGLLDFV